MLKILLGLSEHRISRLKGMATTPGYTPYMTLKTLYVAPMRHPLDNIRDTTSAVFGISIAKDTCSCTVPIQATSWGPRPCTRPMPRCSQLGARYRDVVSILFVVVVDIAMVSVEMMEFVVAEILRIYLIPRAAH